MTVLQMVILVVLTNQLDAKTESMSEPKEQEIKSSQRNVEMTTPDMELLLFLSEFGDAQGDWVDPEVFNKSEEMTSEQKLEDMKSEDHPNL